MYRMALWDGSTVDLAGSGRDFPSNLARLDFGPHGFAIMNLDPSHHEGGDPVLFKNIEGPAQGSYIVRPDDPLRPYFAVPGSDMYHFIGGGEMLFFPSGVGMQEPSPSWRDQVTNIVNQRYRTDNLKYNRISHLLSLYSNDPNRTDTFWYHHLHRQQRWGATTPGVTGWYYRFIPFSTPGITTHYNTLFWIGLEYLRNPTPETWGAGLAMALGVASYGMHWTGVRKGFFRDEGGSTLRGEVKLGWFDKQVELDGLALWWYLSGHPLLKKAVFNHLDSALRYRNTDPGAGGYGERQTAWCLRNLMLAFKITGDHLYADNFNAIADNALAQASKMTLWKELPGAQSLWMAYKTLGELSRWVTKSDPRRERVDLLVESGYDLIDWDFHNYPRVAYRYPPDFSESHPSTHLALATLPLRSAGMVTEEENLLLHLNRHIGSLWQDVATNTPVPLSDVTFMMGYQGSGWLKSVPIILTGAIL